MLENQIRRFHRKHKGKSVVERFVRGFVSIGNATEELMDNRVILRNLKRLKRKR